MPDLLNRLAALHDAAPTAVGDDVVAADLRRGRAALTTRRRRRVAVVGVAAAAVVAAGSVSYAAVTGTSTSRSPARAVASGPVDTGTTAATTGNPPPSVVTVQLVDYQGAQLPGYTVAKVPEGYVLQGVSDTVLTIARAGDTSSLDTFAGKLVVMLDDQAAPADGRAVSVGGKPGHLTDDDGTLLLHYDDGTHHVTVQAWKDVAITPAALITFAEGVTVLPNAQEGHG